MDELLHSVNYDSNQLILKREITKKATNYPPIWLKMINDCNFVVKWLILLELTAARIGVAGSLRITSGYAGRYSGFEMPACERKRRARYPKGVWCPAP